MGTHRLLLLDGHGSHQTMEFLAICDKHRIIPFFFPPHTTNYLQPLDVACFSPYKHYHGLSVNEAVRQGCINYSKAEFLAGLQLVRTKALTVGTIRSGFRDTGIHPFDPSMVIDILPQPSEPAHDDLATSPAPVLSSPTTPYTPRHLTRSINRLQGRETPLSPSIIRVLKGALPQILAGEQAKLDLEKQNAVSQARLKRSQNQRIVGRGGGVIQVGEARVIEEARWTEHMAQRNRLRARQSENAQRLHTVIEANSKQRLAVQTQGMGESSEQAFWNPAQASGSASQ